MLRAMLPSDMPPILFDGDADIKIILVTSKPIELMIRRRHDARL